MKLQKFIAHAGYCSRRKAEKFIEQGRVQVNGTKAHIGQVINAGSDKVTVNGTDLTPLKPSEMQYFLVNKPVNYISTVTDDKERKTVVELVENATNERVYPVGRLDADSEGLMLVTNDGDLAMKLTHPRFHIPKTYHVLVKNKPTWKSLNHLRKGVKLKDGYTQPAEVNKIPEKPVPDGYTWLEITIHEGRNRQIRRMMDRVGYPVERLIRVSFGPWTLEMLKKKKYLQLSYQQVKNSLSENF